MQHILNNTAKLYKLNNLTINSSKSDLLHIKPKLQKSTTIILLIYKDQTIISRNSEEIIRYLGIFFDRKGSTKPTFEIVYNKIKNFLSLIKYKKLTLLQISFLFNLIL